MKHIVFQQCVKDALQQLPICQRHTFILFPQYFGEGPLFQLYSEKGLRERIKWLEKHFHWDAETLRTYEWQLFGAVRDVSRIKEEEVVIWTCDNAHEQFGLRFVCDLLERTSCRIDICNTASNGMLLMPEKSIQHSGQLPKEAFEAMIRMHLMTPLLDEEKQTLSLEAIQAMHIQSKLRSFQHNKLVHEPDTRDDAFILACASELEHKGEVDFQLLVKEVLRHATHSIAEPWIRFRIRELCKQRKMKLAETVLI